jgi:hypothetical protein
MKRLLSHAACVLLCLSLWTGVSRAHEFHYRGTDAEALVDQPVAGQDGNAAAIDRSVVELLEYYYRLFSDVCHQCPTGSQSRTLASAEEIHALLHGFRTSPAAADDVKRVLAASRSYYAGLRAEYRCVTLRWDSQGWKAAADAAPIELATGITRHILVELENGASQTVVAHSGKLPGGNVCPVAAAIPAGEARGFLVPLRADNESIRDVALEFNVEGAANSQGAVHLAVQVRPHATLRGTLVDAETGRSTPGRVTVRCSDGILRHARMFADNMTLSEKPVVFRPAMMKLPFFYSDGTFEIDVPPGPTTLIFERGFESPSVTENIDAAAGQTQSVTLSTRRFLDMRARGWVSGDTHIHWAKNSWDENESIQLLSLVQRAEDLRVANNLTLYQWRSKEQGGPFTIPDQFPMGPVAEQSSADYLMQMAEEYRNDNHYGHINLLNIREMIRPLASGPGSGGPTDAYDYPINRTVIKAAREQGGISVEAHNLGPCFCSDVPVNVALGMADSLDQLDPDHYYRFLNCGFHIGLSNGSDHPARVAGCCRVYVRTVLPLTYPNWIEGLRRGRTFTTSGPLVFLTVNDADIGDTLDVASGTVLRVQARVVSRAPVGTLQVVSNGEVLRTVQSGEKETAIQFELPAEASRWFVVRASRSGSSFNAIDGPDIAHSSAIYVRVSGREVVRREAVEFWIDNVRQHAQRVETTARFANADQRKEALDHIAEGLARYEALLKANAE